MRERLERVAAFFHDWSPWLMVGALALWASPWFLTALGVRLPIDWTTLLAIHSLPLVVLAAMLPAGATTDRRTLVRRVCAVSSIFPAVALASVLLEGLAPSLGFGLPSWVLGLPWYVWLAALGAVLVVVDTAGRPSLSPQQVELRLATTSTALAVAGSIASSLGAGVHFACFSPPSPATGAPCGVVEPLDYRIALHGIGLGVLVSAALLRRRSLLLGAIGVWLGTRIGLDLCTRSAAQAACEGLAGGEDLVGLAVVFARLEFVGAGITVALVVGALLRSRIRGTRVPRVWPVLPVLVLSASAAFDPPLSTGFPQSRPEAIWREVGVEPIRWESEGDRVPFLQSRSVTHPSFVLAAGGELHVFGGGSHHMAQSGEVTAIDPFYATGVLADRDATLDDLRSALPHLRRARSIELVFLRNPGEALPSVAERWPFVDMAHRDVRARVVDVWREPGRQCRTTFETGTSVTRCRHPRWDDDGARFVMLGELGDISIDELLRTTDARFAIHLSDQLERGEVLVSAARGRWRPPERRVLAVGVPPAAAFAGALFAFLALLVSQLVRRWLFVRGKRVGRASPTSRAPVFPIWLPERHAALEVAEVPGPPYRNTEGAWRTAPPHRMALAFCELSVRSCLRWALAGLGWLTVAVALGACAYGLSVLEELIP